MWREQGDNGVINSKYLFLILFLFFVCHAKLLSAQQWEYYTVDEGLVGNSVWQIMEDKLGYLWIITDFHGASRYDGTQFQNFNSSNGLVSNNIYYALATQDGSVWFCTDRGLSRFLEDHFFTIDTSNGLISNNVTLIHEDRDGYLWFATDMGVSRFDGKNFKNFDLRINHSNTNVLTILDDSFGSIWIGTDKGLFKYDGSGNQYPKNLWVDDYINLIFEDSGGSLWFASENGLYRKSLQSKIMEGPIEKSSVSAIVEDHSWNIWVGTLDQGTLCYSSNGSRKQKLAGHSIRSMLPDCRGNIWLGTDRGIFKCDADSCISISKQLNYKVNFVSAIWEDTDENIWFGTEKGILKRIPEKITHYTVHNGLLDNKIESIFEDDAGIIWLGSASGLSYFDGRSFHRKATVINDISCVFQDRRNDYWVGTVKGVYRNFELIKDEASLQQRSIRKILEDTSNNVWIATAEGITKYDGSNYYSFPAEEIWDMFIDGAGNIWLASWNNGVYKYDTKGELFNYQMEDGLGSNHIDWIYETCTGNLVFGLKGGFSITEGQKKPQGGICIFDGKVFRNFASTNGLPSNQIIDVIEDGEGILWFASDKGVIKCSLGDTVKFRVLSATDGLISNAVASVHLDRNGDLWFGTDKGVSKYDGEIFQNISLKKSLSIGFIEDFFEDSHGNIWFLSSSEGIFRYCPPVKQVGPRIHITQIEADKLYKYHYDVVEIPVNNNRVTFEYKGISFKSRAEQLRYTYILEGFDRNWVSPIRKTRLFYPDLEPGNYTLKVKAIDKDLLYSDPPALAKVFVYTPFYRTSWFYVVSIFIISVITIGIFFLFIQLRKQNRLAVEYREKLRKQQEAEHIQIAKMASLRQLIAGVAHEMNNPIGALAGINDVSSRAVKRIKKVLDRKVFSKIEEKDQLIRTLAILEDACETTQQASTRVTKVITDLRRFVTLDEAEWQDFNINEGIENALILLETDLKPGISIKKLYGQLPKAYCSPSSLNQVFITILKNASEAIEEGGKIEIKTAVINRNIVAEIKDNGVGIAPENLEKIFDPGFTTKGVKVGVGLGLSICHKIVVEEHGGHIEVRSQLGKGTTFLISIPEKFSEQRDLKQNDQALL